MKQLLNLEIGKKYTFVKLGDFGFPYSAQLELVEKKIEPYAQHKETVVLTFKLKGKRNLRSLRIFERDDYLVYEGWVVIDTEMHVESKPEINGTICKISLASFDIEYLLRAKRSVEQSPLIENINEKS